MTVVLFFGGECKFVYQFIHVAPVWVRSGVDFGSVRGGFEIGLVSDWGRFGITLGSVWGRLGIGSGSVSGRFGIGWGRLGIGLGGIRVVCS